MQVINEQLLSRFEVIDHRTGGEGRVLVAYCKVDLSVQDEGRTLKVFLQNQDKYT